MRRWWRAEPYQQSQTHVRPEPSQGGREGGVSNTEYSPHHRFSYFVGTVSLARYEVVRSADVLHERLQGLPRLPSVSLALPFGDAVDELVGGELLQVASGARGGIVRPRADVRRGRRPFGTSDRLENCLARCG